MIRIISCVLVAIFLPMPFAATTRGDTSAGSGKVTDQEIIDFARQCGVRPGVKDERKINRFSQRAYNISKSWEDLDALAVDADLALGRMVDMASDHFIRVGDNQNSKRILAEYKKDFEGYFSKNVAAKAIGDHAPMSEWLAKWTRRLEQTFGPRFMEMSRLKDLKTFNYAIPVVFNPQGEIRSTPIVPWERGDYVDHFVPFAGAVAYWVAWGSCTAGAWGLGWVTFLCSWAGWAAEYVVMTEVAPGLGGKIWDRYNIPETAWRKALKAIGL